MGRIILATVTMLSLLATQASAATSNWAVLQALGSGERIEVHLANGSKLSGELERVTPETLYVAVRSGTVGVPRAEVGRVYTKSKGNRLAAMLIGTAAGAGVGGGLGGRYMENETGYGGAVAGCVGLGALIGMGVGAAVSKGSKKTLVYEAPN